MNAEAPLAQGLHGRFVGPDVMAPVDQPVDLANGVPHPGRFTLRVSGYRYLRRIQVDQKLFHQHINVLITRLFRLPVFQLAPKFHLPSCGVMVMEL